MMLSELWLPAAVGKRQSQPCHRMSQFRLTRAQGKAWKERIGKLVNRQLNAVEAKDATKLKLCELETLARITDATDRTARRTFGLDSTAPPGTHLLVHVQSDLAISQTCLPWGSDQVIDVETEIAQKSCCSNSLEQR